VKTTGAPYDIKRKLFESERTAESLVDSSFDLTNERKPRSIRKIFREKAIIQEKK
jgi:hypothetical protein